MRSNAGRQFAPELVTAFCRGMLNELAGEPQQKRFRRLLGKEYMDAETLVPQLKTALNDLSGTSARTIVGWN